MNPRAEHFSDADRHDLLHAGDRLMAWARDWVFHEHDGDGWYPTFEDDPACLADELQRICTDCETALTQTRMLLHRATSAARLRALTDRRRQETRHAQP